MKLKKLFSILLAVVLAFTMAVSVSASKRLDINGQIVIGVLEWSGTPESNETLTATTKMRFSDPAYGLQATLSGSYELYDGTRGDTGTRTSGVWYGTVPPEVSINVNILDGHWVQGNARYDAYYGNQHTTAYETKTWHNNN